MVSITPFLLDRASRARPRACAIQSSWLAPRKHGHAPRRTQEGVRLPQQMHCRLRKVSSSQCSTIVRRSSLIRTNPPPVLRKAHRPGWAPGRGVSPPISGLLALDEASRGDGNFPLHGWQASGPGVTIAMASCCLRVPARPAACLCGYRGSSTSLRGTEQDLTCPRYLGEAELTLVDLSTPRSGSFHAVLHRARLCIAQTHLEMDTEHGQTIIIMMDDRDRHRD